MWQVVTLATFIVLLPGACSLCYFLYRRRHLRLQVSMLVRAV